MKISFAPLFLAALFCSLQLATSFGIDWKNPCTFFPFPFAKFCKIFPFPSTNNGTGSASGSGNGGANTTGNATRALPLVGKLPLGLPLR